MTRCQYLSTKPTAPPEQLRREVLFCQCIDCREARHMSQGLRLSMRKTVRERFHALSWQPPKPEPVEPFEGPDAA